MTDLKRQYDDLYRIQQQILYIFSRYLAAYPLPTTMDGNSIAAAPARSSSTGEDRGGKRQRLLGDGSGHPAYSTVDVAPAQLVNGGVGAVGLSAAQVPFSSSASTLAALLSSTEPAAGPPVQPLAVQSSLSARDAEIRELSALQTVLTQLPALGQAQPGGQMTATTAAALVSALHNYQTRGNSPALPAANPVQHININDANNALAALAAPGGPLSYLSPLMLSALTALGNAGAASAAAQPQQPPQHVQQQQHQLHQQQTLPMPSGNALAPASQLSGLSSLSALPPLANLSTSSAPLSAADLMQLLQHAHPDNRASRLSAIRQEQRMLDDEDDDMDDEEDDQRYDTDTQYAATPHAATAADWMPFTAASLIPGLRVPSVLSETGFNQAVSPRRLTAASVESKLPSSSFHPGSMSGMFDSYTAQPASTAVAKAAGRSGVAPFKTQPIGSLFSDANDPYMSLHSQLAAASSSQNAASSVSMSSSIVSPATPLHLQPSSSVSHDGGVLLMPQMHATLSQLLAGGSAAPLMDANSGAFYSAGGSSGRLSDAYTHAALVDDIQEALPNVNLSSQLQAIANVSRHLQNMYNPNISSALHPSTTSAFDPSHGGQQAASYQPLGLTAAQLSNAYAPQMLFDDKYQASAATAQAPFYPQLHTQQHSILPPLSSAVPAFAGNSPSLSAFNQSSQPYSHPYASDALSGLSADSYQHTSAGTRHSHSHSHGAVHSRSHGSGGGSVASRGSFGLPAPPL